MPCRAAAAGCTDTHAAHFCRNCNDADSDHMSFKCPLRAGPASTMDTAPSKAQDPKGPTASAKKPQHELEDFELAAALHASMMDTAPAPSVSTPPPPPRDPSVVFVYSGSVEKDNAATDKVAEDRKVFIRVWFRWDGTDASLDPKEGDMWVPYSHTVCDAITAGVSDDACDVIDVGYGYDYVKGTGMQQKRENNHLVRWVRGCSVCWEWNKGEPRTPDYQPYSQEDQWRLEEAYAKGERRLELLGPGGDKYTMHLRRTPMVQVLTSDPTRERFVRRIGPPNRRLTAMTPPKYWKEIMPHAMSTNPGSSVIMPLPAGHPVFCQVQLLMDSCIDRPHQRRVGEVWHLEPAKRTHPTRFEVTGVSIVNNKRLWVQYEDMRRHLGEKYKDTAPLPVDLRTTPFPVAPLCEGVNEGWFFHGTGPVSATSDIIDLVTKGSVLDDTVMLSAEDQLTESQGMNARFSDTKGMFGGGVYLADLSSKANLYVTCPGCFGGAYRGPKVADCKCTSAPTAPYRMLICRALLGKAYFPSTDAGAYTEAVFKVRNPLLGIPGEYDSIVAEKGVGKSATYAGLAFREIMVYDGAQVYPEIIVEYKRIA